MRSCWSFTWNGTGISLWPGESQTKCRQKVHVSLQHRAERASWLFKSSAGQVKSLRRKKAAQHGAERRLREALCTICVPLRQCSPFLETIYVSVSVSGTVADTHNQNRMIQSHTNAYIDPQGYSIIQGLTAVDAQHPRLTSQTDNYSGTERRSQLTTDNSGADETLIF